MPDQKIQSLVEYHLIRHMKTNKAGPCVRDQDRAPNKLGDQQLKTLAQTLQDEGTVFDKAFYSPVHRALTLAEAVMGRESFSEDDKLFLIPIPELYDPNPESADEAEIIDAAVLLRATELFGYDLKKWYSNKLVVSVFNRRTKAAARKIRIPKRRGKIIKVAVVGHFLYLNALAEQLYRGGNGTIRNTSLGECGRLVIRDSKDGYQVLYVPLGTKLTDVFFGT